MIEASVPALVLDTAVVVPSMLRPGVGLVTIDRWRARDRAHQERLGRASLDAGHALPWPAGLVGHHVALGTEGDMVLHYSQWSGRAALDRFSADGSDERAAWVQQRGGVADHLSSVRLRRYRTMRGPGHRRQPTGCLVLVSLATTSPGQQVALVDGIVHNATTQQPIPHQLLASHFHVSLDGTRVVDVAELVTADAHRRVVEWSPGEDSPVVRFIAAQQGVEVLGFERFEPFGTIRVPD